MSFDALRPSETLAQTLTRALAAAQVAVNLDAADQDTMGIVLAYQRCISLLDDVIRREPSDEEADRLRTIRATYRDRVQFLLLSRSVPVPQKSTETLISTQEEQFKPRRWIGCSPRVSSRKARRWAVERLKGICGCTSGSVTI